MNKPSTLYTAIDLETPQTIAYDDAFSILQDGDVFTEHGLMRWGSNYTFLVNARRDNQTFLAVYKPRMGERPLWDFPDGTLCQRETASFVISEMLGWYLVPPTVLRDGPRGIGSIQVFINHDPNRHYFTFDETHQEQLQRMALFDILNNNADRKGGHCLLDETDRLWGIDHGLTFHPSYKLRTVIWDFAGQPIPKPLLADLTSFCEKLEDENNPQRRQLTALIANFELMALSKRLTRLIDNGFYPMPGPGPNRPWPAI